LLAKRYVYNLTQRLFYILALDTVTATASVETDMDKMRKKALKVGLEIFDVPQNGSCMFAALAHQLGRNEEAELVRAEIVQFMKTEPSMVMLTTCIT
jgi:hypothetical protein